MKSQSISAQETALSNDLNETCRRVADLKLVNRALVGDPEAFATLFNTHKPAIYSICLRMTNNIAQAEDLTQDAFLQVFRKLSTFRGNSALSTWLYRIAVNTVLMHFRKKVLKQVSLDETSGHDSTPVRWEHGSRDGRLDESVDRIMLARALTGLPPGYRTIFLLHEVEGYNHDEIARMLDFSVGNSKSQLHKAKRRIREFLSVSAPRTDHLSAPGVNSTRTLAQRNRGEDFERRSVNHAQVAGVFTGYVDAIACLRSVLIKRTGPTDKQKNQTGRKKRTSYRAGHRSSLESKKVTFRGERILLSPFCSV